MGEGKTSPIDSPKIKQKGFTMWFWILLIADLCSESVDVPWWLYLLLIVFGGYGYSRTRVNQ